jgi:flagellar hook-associated protein 1 FlgK
MSIDAALLIARSGLQYTQRALSNAANNVANAETEGYTRKKITSLAVSVEAHPMGVRSLGPSRDVDNAVLAEINARRSALAGAETRSSILSAVDVAHGQVENANGLGDLTAKLKDSFIELRLDPTQVVKQQAIVLVAAEDLANRFNDISKVIGQQRQLTEDGVFTEIGKINAGLRQIATLTENIIKQTGANQPKADLEDQRDIALKDLSQCIAFKTIRQENGGLILLGAGGITLPLVSDGDAFVTQRSTISPESYYGAGGSIPGITLLGVDVTQQMVGGRLGEYIQLRDQVLPRYQAELDIAASEIADRFRAEGLRLFVDTAGNVPDPNQPYAGSPQIGFATAMSVNPIVRADSRLLRDGTETLTGPPVTFTPNPINGPGAFTTLIDNILDHTFGETEAPGVSWGGFATSGLGPDGTLSSPFGAPRTIGEYTAWLTATQTADNAAATRALDMAKDFSDGIEARFAKQSSVDVDSEMASLVQLQNAYAANARVLSTAQSMWETLFGSVR